MGLVYNTKRVTARPTASSIELVEVPVSVIVFSTMALPPWPVI